MSNFSAISRREQVNFQWNDDEVRCVLDQHTVFDFYSASSLEKQTAGKHVTPLRHIFLCPNQRIKCSYSLKLIGYLRSSKIEFYNLWFDPTWLEPTIYHTRGQHAVVCGGRRHSMVDGCTSSYTIGAFD